MSKRGPDNTGLNLTLGILIACCAAALAWSELSDQAPHAVSNDYETSKYADRAQSRVQALCIDISGATLAECIIEIEQSERANHRAQKDLKAQRYMAIWAFVMALSGIITVGITGAGLYWLRRTFIQTQGAVTAANAAVEVTREIGEAQVRAYIGIAGAEFKNGGGLALGVGDELNCEIMLKNFGNSPPYISKIVRWEKTVGAALQGRLAEPTPPHDPVVV